MTTLPDIDSALKESHAGIARAAAASEFSLRRTTSLLPSATAITSPGLRRALGISSLRPLTVKCPWLTS